MNELTQVTQSEYFRVIKESTEELILFYSEEVLESCVFKKDYVYEYEIHGEDRYRLDGTIFSSCRIMKRLKCTKEDGVITRWPIEEASTIYYLSKYYEPFEDAKKMPHDEFKKICGGS